MRDGCEGVVKGGCVGGVVRVGEGVVKVSFEG